MATAETIIIDAFIEARVSDHVDGPTTAEKTVGLRWLNRIIARASAKNVFLPYSTSENFSATDGTASYTMGSGGTASSARARKITNAYVRDSDGNDSPLSIISEKVYNAITDKDFEGKPSTLFYDPVYATGVIYLYPVPDSTYTVYIESQKDLHSTLSIDTTISLPGEYEDALVLTLAAKVARANGSTSEQSCLFDAERAWKTILNLNISQRVPIASLPFQRNSGSNSLFSPDVVVGFPFQFGFLLT